MSWDELFGQTRRTFLKATVAAGAISTANTVYAQDGETFEFGATVDGWQARQPARLRGMVNPTVAVWPGTHEIIWENQDGEPHGLVIEDEEGAIIDQTDVVATQGTTRTVTISVGLGSDSPPPARYYCPEHPETMAGTFRLYDYPAYHDGTASVTFTDGESDGATVTVDSVSFTLTAGFVAIYQGDPFEELGSANFEVTEVYSEQSDELFLGVSDSLHMGEHTDVEVPLETPLEEGTERTLAAIPYISPERELENSTPYQEPEGYVVTDLATITVGNVTEEVNAEILEFATESRTVEPGDIVESTVTVENTGDVEHTFFVGYSLFGPDGNEYHNEGTTGTTVTLGAQERAAVGVSWRVPSDAPAGEYDALTIVWEESDVAELDTQLDDARDENIIEVTTDQEPSERLEQIIESKRSLASEIDDTAVYLSEQNEVESLLSEYRERFENDEFEDDETPVNAVHRSIFGERVSQTLLINTSDAEGIGDRPQLAVKTTDFAIRLGVSIAMMQFSFTEFLNDSRLAPLVPNGELTRNALDNALEDLVSIGFSTALQSEAMTAITNIADDLYEEAPQFETGEDFADAVTDRISTAAADLTFQQTIETGDGVSPLQSHLPTTIIDRFANIDSALAYLNSELSPEKVREEGLNGTHQGALNASGDASAQIDEIASIADTFLNELTSRADFLGIFKNIFDLHRGLQQGDIKVWKAAGLLGKISTYSGKAISTVNAIGIGFGWIVIRLLMTIHARGIVGVQKGSPVTLDDVSVVLPDTSSTLNDIAAVGERWEVPLSAGGSILR